jgi:cytochrome b6-f complex iron-sulfur subunit
LRICRRQFCTQASCAASLAILSPAFTACGSPTGPSLEDKPIQAVGAAIVNGTLVMTIDAASPLAAPGTAVIVDNSLGKFLVAHTGPETFVALTAVCTHFGCTIVRFDNPIFECPCHGSRFDTSGAVVRGPASAPLRQFPTRLNGDVLTIFV